MLVVHSQCRLTNIFAFSNVTLSMRKTTKQLTSRRRQNINLKAFGNLEITVWAQFVREICCSLNLHPTWKHGHAQKRPTPLLTLGIGVHTQAKNLMIFCSMLWAGANSQKFGVICGITCGNSQHIRMLQMTPQFLKPSVAEQNISRAAKPAKRGRLYWPCKKPDV